MLDKHADLAGPGIGSYEEVASVLPTDYNSLLTPRETMQALYGVKSYIEDNLCKALNLDMVQVPLIVDRESGVNDMLDRDGSRTPVEFPCGLGLDKPINAQVVQAATKWKRMALKTFDCQIGQGICTDMKAVRKDYFLDHDHSAYVDQWDWERAITAEDRNLDHLVRALSDLVVVHTYRDHFGLKLIHVDAAAEFLEAAGSPQLYRPAGCGMCGNSGFRGRAGVFEILEPDAPFRESVATGADLEAAARACANIALGKYWGKADVRRNIPAVPSISLTLDKLVTDRRREGRSLARDLKESGVAVSLIHPGMVATDMTGGRGVPVVQSAGGIIERMEALDISDTGSFWHAQGERLPW